MQTKRYEREAGRFLRSNWNRLDFFLVRFFLSMKKNEQSQ